MEVWLKRPHRCFVTGESLEKYKSSNLFVNLFAHILRKSAYPHWKYEHNNIVLLKPEVHTLFDDGVLERIVLYEEENKCSFKGLFELEEKKHEIYAKEYKSVPRKRKIIDKYKLTIEL